MRFSGIRLQIFDSVMSDYHIPVLLDESIEALLIQPDGVYIDATFGAGGHSKSILKRLDAKGHLYGFDQDEDAHKNEIASENFTFIPSNFRYMQRWLKVYGVEEVDGILMDLGVSSHQLDDDERGFSYRFEADLDMRMNKQSPLDAKRVVATYTQQQLQEVFSKYGEVRNAKTLAQKIVQERKLKPVVSSRQLNDILDSAIVGPKLKYYSQVYQAIRMEVNDELGVLTDALHQAVDILKPGGRLVVISYHSLEDRLVKKLIKTGNVSGDQLKDDYGKIHRPLKAVNKQIILPTEEEMKRNNRARSAKLRIAIKV